MFRSNGSLVVGRTLLGLDEDGVHALHVGLGDHNRPGQQLPEVNLHRQALQLEHLPLLLILDLEALQIDLLGEYVHAHVVDLHLCLQFLLQPLGGDGEQFVLHHLSVQQHGGRHE